MTTGIAGDLWSGLSALLAQDFMRRALAGSILLAIAAAPVGVFLVMRRMSLIGDAVGHAILPGAAGAALIGGGNPWAMSAGAAATGAVVLGMAGWTARRLRLPEDSGLAVFYLAALAGGVTLAGLSGGAVDLERLLFGAVLALDDSALQLCALAAAVSLPGIWMLYRPLLTDTMNPELADGTGTPPWVLGGYYALLALVMIASFHALGALMAVGMTILPAIAARFWARTVPGAMLAAALIGSAGASLGLVMSWMADTPAGASIVLALVAAVLLSALADPARRRTRA